MNKTLVHLIRGRSVARIAIAILGLTLVTAPEAYAFGRFGGGGGGRYHPSGGGGSHDFGSDGFGVRTVSHINSNAQNKSSTPAAGLTVRAALRRWRSLRPVPAVCLPFQRRLPKSIRLPSIR